MMTQVRALAVLASVLMPIPGVAADMVVNGVALDAKTRQALERTYGVPIKPGRYWYDKVSGVWGLEGGPAAGQIHPNLNLGGTLKRDASKGMTGVIVNGRELHEKDVAALQRCMQVIPGRYWVWANGVGGPEGQPPQFNLAVMCGAKGGGSSMNCEDYGNGQYNCSNQRTGIGIIGEGGGQGAVFIDGKVIMTPN